MIRLNYSQGLAARPRARYFPALLLLAGLLAASAPAQTFTTLHSFTASSKNSSGNYTNSDGYNPLSELVISGNTLYGTATGGGPNGDGTVFTVNTDGTGFTNLHIFTALNINNINSDGAYPYAGLILSGNTLYGSAQDGGSSGAGTVFEVLTNGASFTNLHSFNYFSAENPQAGLILSANTLYGTAVSGGAHDSGTVFAVNTNGTGFTNLHVFTATSANSSGGDTNSDGAFPSGGLILSGNTLYGTAALGGTNDSGTVFAVNTDGTGFTILHTFTSVGRNAQFFLTNSDGATPTAGLILAGNTLYGTTSSGNTNGTGTVFAVNTDGTGFTNLHTFTAATSIGSQYLDVNSDGAYPYAGLILSGNTLYGATDTGGTNGTGTVFALNTNGTGFTTLYSFTAVSGSTDYPSSGTNSDGALLHGLILSGSTLYGTANAGGSAGAGTVFSLSFPPPQLTINLSETNVVMTWPAGYAGFSYSGYALQATTNLVAPVVWTTYAAAPVIVNGQNTVTNPISGTQMFFRLQP
jgi:uncharacterized repeat protein (TIGR03803 family)